jgi:lipid-A-disaccharide synthase
MKLNRVYIISGEASGDLHGGKLCKELKKINPDIQIRGWGGDQLASAGAIVDVRYERVNFMGFTEVLKNIFTILKLLRQTKKTILEYKPDALILIDYPGFNLRMASWAKANSIPVYYYIAPQVWAWKEKRVKILKEAVKKLFIILPFEKDFFSKHGLTSYYYGHPLLQLIHEFKYNRDFRIKNQLTNQSIIAILPGSRRQEIKTMLPIYLEAVKKECKFQIVLAGLTQHQDLYESICNTSDAKIKIVYNDTYNLLHQAKLAIVTSGTATLETGLFGVPEVICYKGNRISFEIAKRLIKVELTKLKNHTVRRRIKSELRSIQSLLTGGNPYEKVAEEIMRNE